MEPRTRGGSSRERGSKDGSDACSWATVSPGASCQREGPPPSVLGGSPRGLRSWEGRSLRILPRFRTFEPASPSKADQPVGASPIPPGLDLQRCFTQRDSGTGAGRLLARLRRRHARAARHRDGGRREHRDRGLLREGRVHHGALGGSGRGDSARSAPPVSRVLPRSDHARRMSREPRLPSDADAAHGLVSRRTASTYKEGTPPDGLQGGNDHPDGSPRLR